MNEAFGSFVREVRERRRQTDSAYSLRRVAERLEIEPAYLSKIERGDLPPPSESVVTRLAAELGEDPDMLLALAGKVASDLRAIIRRRPREFAQLIRQLQDAPDDALLQIVRDVRGSTR